MGVVVEEGKNWNFSMSLSKSKIFLLVCLAFIAGVFLGRFLNLELMVIIAMSFIVVVSLFWNYSWAKVLGLTGIVMILGIFRFTTFERSSDLTNLFSQKVNLSAIIVNEPDARSDKTYLTAGKLFLKGDSFGQRSPLSGQILISVPRFPEYAYGDKIEFLGKVVEPKEAEAKGEFSYKNYLSRFGIDAVMYYPPIKVVDRNQGNKIKQVLLKIKFKFLNVLTETLPEPQQSFLAGLLVGARRSIPVDLTEAFNRTGTSHIVALSGFNITIIAQALNFLLSRFGRRISFGLSLLCIIAFVILSGASASVVRAGVMGALGLVALNMGRLYTINNALALTAAVMVGINPKILHFDVGFQLSFAALLGIVYLLPIMEPYFYWCPKLIKGFLLPTIAAQIATLGIIVYYFDRLSLVALPANLLTLPLVPATMLLGFLSGILGLIFLPLGQIAAALSWVLLTYIIKVVEFFSSLSFAALSVSSPLWLAIIYYLILIWLLWKTRPKKSLSF